MNIIRAAIKKAYLRLFNPEDDRPDITIEQRLFYRVMFISGVISIFFLAINISFNMLNEIMICMFSIGLINFFLLYYITKIKNIFNSKVLIYTVLFLFPIIIVTWFYNGGSSGGRQYIFFPYMLTGLVVLQRFKILYITKTLIVIFILVYIEYTHAELIHSYNTREARYIDIGISFVTYGYISWYIVLFYIREYKSVRMNLLIEKKTVVEQSAKLEEANNRLLDLDQAKTDFFSNISHEFKTPLTLIVSPVESIINGEYGKTLSIDHEIFTSIYRNGVRLQSLIGTLLDFTKIESGKMNLKRKPVDMVKLTDFCVNSVKSHAASRKIRLDFKVKNDPANALIDRELFESVIYNLLSNAFKFTDEGGRVSVAVEAAGGGVIISIQDTGIGIPADKLPFIFDRFSQVDSGSSRKYEGTGIGLAFAKEIIELHGGTIGVRSCHIHDHPDDHGTEFTISVPAAGAVPQQAVEYDERAGRKFIEKKLIADFESVSETKSESLSGHQPVQAIDTGSDESGLHKILVVEDHVDMQHYIKDILKKSASVTLKPNGIKAMEYLDETEELPDLILSDVMMPEMDGYTLTRELRKNKKFEGIPIILLTAKSEISMKVEGLEYGATDYITKPFSVRELMARINSQIQLKKLRDKLEQVNKTLYQRLKNQAGAEPRVSQSTEEKVKKVVEFLEENFTADLSREGLAAAVDLSPDHLSRTFNTITGKRLDEYINELRIEEAKRLLKTTDESVLSIAFQVGFENIRTFNRAFQKITGVVPTEFRTEN